MSLSSTIIKCIFMCQLAAYVGDREATPILLESLRLQEGYMGANARALEHLTKQGKIKRHIRQRIEGGVKVKRITWGL